MGFDDRLSLFILGCLIGLVVGYIVRLLQETRKKIYEVDEHVKDAHHVPRDEKGFMRFRIVADFAMLTVLAITVFAALSTQKVNNDLKDTQAELATTQNRLEGVVFCTQDILEKTVGALNERTTYAGAQAQSNVTLQKAQADMLRILLHVPPYPEAQRAEATQAYFDGLINFLDLSKKQAGKVANNQYPTRADFQTCLDKALEKALEKEE